MSGFINTAGRSIGITYLLQFTSGNDLKPAPYSEANADGFITRLPP
jgi:hypothetical protein